MNDCAIGNELFPAVPSGPRRTTGHPWSHAEQRRSATPATPGPLVRRGLNRRAQRGTPVARAVLSEVSPPTALSPFAAAAITGGDPYKTTMQAWKYTLPAFLVPFVFVLDPQGVGLLMKIPKDGSVWDIVIVSLKTAAGLGALAAAAQNWGLRQNTPVERLLWLLAGLLLVFPSLIEALAERITGMDVPQPAPLGLAIAAVLLLKQWRTLPAKAEAA